MKKEEIGREEEIEWGVLGIAGGECSGSSRGDRCVPEASHSSFYLLLMRISFFFSDILSVLNFSFSFFPFCFYFEFIFF